MDTQCAHTGSVCPLDCSCSILGQSFVCDGIWGVGQMGYMHWGVFGTTLMGWECNESRYRNIGFNLFETIYFP